MSDDLVNQITLNFLISKQQLEKLNKKIKQKEEDKIKTDMEIYKEPIVELFLKMINNELPDDLLEDVKHSYDYFIEKSIYYLKMRLPESYDKESEEDLEEEVSASDKDEISASDKDEVSASDKDLEDSLVNLEEDSEEEDSLVNLDEEVKKYPTIYKKNNKNTNSKGVEDIQQLPLDWFNKVRQTYKQNHIIPRQKDNQEVSESPTNYKNIEKKNISNLYEDKPKNKKNTK